MNVLVVEDNALTMTMITDALETWKHEVTQAFKVVNAISHIRKGGIDLVITDLNIEKPKDGIIVIGVAKEKATPIILMSGDEERLLAVTQRVPFMKKPFRPTDLLKTIKHVV